MVTIDNELVTFKNNVSPSLGTMNSYTSELKDKISNLTSSITEVENGISSYYNSENKSTITGKLNSLTTLYNDLSTSIDGDLTSMLKECSTIVENVTKLEKLKQEIESLSSQVNYSSTSTNNSSLISSIDSKSSEFNTLQTETKNKLNTLKGVDSTMEFVEEYSSKSLDGLTLVGGSFEKRTFKASNGRKLTYYLYVPDYGEPVEGLPVMVYQHGSGERGSGVLNCGLPKQIQNGVVKPKGIVLCIQGTDSFGNSDQGKAIIEATNAIVEEYHADPNKISLSGHSDGAIGAYHLAVNNPNYFSCIVPISGYAVQANCQKIASSNTKVWAFHGAKDPSVGENGTIKTIQQNNGDAYLTSFPSAGHCIQNDIFNTEYEYKDGNKYNPLDWAFEQTLEEK